MNVMDKFTKYLQKNNFNTPGADPTPSHKATPRHNLIKARLAKEPKAKDYIIVSAQIVFIKSKE
jgi:hypothetical protein